MGVVVFRDVVVVDMQRDAGIGREALHDRQQIGGDRVTEQIAGNKADFQLAVRRALVHMTRPLRAHRRFVLLSEFDVFGEQRVLLDRGL